MKVSDVELWLCTDCTMFAVNGDLPADSTPARDKEILAGASAYPPIVANYNSDTGEGMDEFSRRACDCCDSPLAGARTRFAQLVEESTSNNGVVSHAN